MKQDVSYLSDRIRCLELSDTEAKELHALIQQRTRRISKRTIINGVAAILDKRLPDSIDPHRQRLVGVFTVEVEPDGVVSVTPHIGSHPKGGCQGHS